MCVCLCVHLCCWVCKTSLHHSQQRLGQVDDCSKRKRVTICHMRCAALYLLYIFRVFLCLPSMIFQVVSFFCTFLIPKSHINYLHKEYGIALNVMRFQFFKNKHVEMAQTSSHCSFQLPLTNSQLDFPSYQQNIPQTMDAQREHNAINSFFCESVSKFKPRELKRTRAMKERRFYDYFSIVCWIYEIYFNFVKFIVIYSNYINHQYLAHSHIRNMYLMQSILYIRLRYTYIICKIMSRFAFKFSLNCVYGFVSYSLCRCLCSLCKCFFCCVVSLSCHLFRF